MARLRFVTPPGWPDSPEGWLPPASWRPPADWPAPPSDWQFYVDAYGYPTPPPLEYWQPWPAVDWDEKLRLPDDPPVMGSNVWTSHAQPPMPLKRPSVWLPVVAGLLVLALLVGGAVWYVRTKGSPLGPDKVSSVSGLYEPPLRVGAESYVKVGTSPKPGIFSGGGDCITRANKAVDTAKETVLAGTNRGWTAVTWRFETTDAAKGSFGQLGDMLTGCKDKEYTFANPVKGDGFVQFDQIGPDKTAHGKVVLTSDANVVTWIEGGKEDLGKTAFGSIRKRLLEIN